MKTTEQMTGEELLDWSIKNVKNNNWISQMSIKLMEERVKKFTPEQIEAIDIFVTAISRGRFQNGFGEYVRLSDINELFLTIKSLKENK